MAGATFIYLHTVAVNAVQQRPRGFEPAIFPSEIDSTEIYLEDEIRMVGSSIIPRLRSGNPFDFSFAKFSDHLALVAPECHLIHPELVHQTPE